MASGRHLRRKGYTWFFRFRWPKRFATCWNPGELDISLKTGDRRCALAHLTGRSPDSKQFHRYANAAIAKAASAAATFARRRLRRR
jgi:hypothetical protein